MEQLINHRVSLHSKLPPPRIIHGWAVCRGVASLAKILDHPQCNAVSPEAGVACMSVVLRCCAVLRFPTKEKDIAKGLLTGRTRLKLSCAAGCWQKCRGGEIFRQRLCGSAAQARQPDNCLALELVTPKLPFNSEGRRKLCAILQAAFSPFFHSGLQVNQTCGVHVHVDMSGVRQGRISIAELKEAICNFICAYPTLALLVSESRRGSRFCKELPSSSRDLQQVQSCRSVEEILELYNLDRNFALNVQPLARPSPTIEVRFFEATSEPEEVQHMVATVFRVLAGTVPVQSSYSPEVADVLDSVSLPGWEEFGGKAWLKRRMEKVRRRDAQAPPVFVECPGMILILIIILIIADFADLACWPLDVIYM